MKPKLVKAGAALSPHRLSLLTTRPSILPPTPSPAWTGTRAPRIPPPRHCARWLRCSAPPACWRTRPLALPPLLIPLLLSAPLGPARSLHSPRSGRKGKQTGSCGFSTEQCGPAFNTISEKVHNSCTPTDPGSAMLLMFSSHTLSLSFSLPLSHFLSLSLSLAVSHFLSPPFSLSSFSHSLTLRHCVSHTRSFTHSLSPSLAPSPPLSNFLSLSHPLSHPHTLT